jgi:hypothetical protein
MLQSWLFAIVFKRVLLKEDEGSSSGIWTLFFFHSFPIEKSQEIQL